MLNWSDRFNICCFLDNHHYNLPLHSQECLLAAGSINVISTRGTNSFSELEDFISNQPDWLFGHLGFDLKNEIEDLHSSHPDHIGFDDLSFFVPEVVVMLSANEISIGIKGNDHVEIFDEIVKMQMEVVQKKPFPTVNISQRFSRSEYVDVIESLRNHILRGDCYEINFCMEFFAEEVDVNPLLLYQSLVEVSPNPFSAFYKINDRYLLCASPERYLKKQGDAIFSQPIKGTWERDLKDTARDQHNRLSLLNSRKDRSENVMVVDLVRNDLARICKEGQVQVDELFGVYSFPQVHQMISTISGKIRDDISIADVFRATFPMGSMTGAPKKRVMELIEQYEKSGRGLFSGAVGYITPERDFDFNVVIRSILYNSSNQYLSFQVGSGITFYSDAEKEYEECLLKASAIQKVLMPR